MAVDEHNIARRDPDTFDVRESLRAVTSAVRYHKRVVWITCVLTLAAAVWYAWAWPPIYRADAEIMVEKDTDASRDAFYGSWNIFRKDDSRTEIELMTSGPVLKEVIEKEHLTYDDIYHPLMSQLSYFWEKSWVGRHYKAVKRRIFPDPDEKILSAQEIQLGRTISDMAAGITIQPIGESNVGKVSIKGPSPKVAAIANTLLDVYMADRVERYQGEAQKSYDLLTGEVALAEKDLRDIDHRREEYSAKHGLVFDLQKEDIQLRQLTDMEASITTAKAHIADMEASLREVEKQLAVEPDTRTVSSSYELNAVRESTKLRRLELQTALIQAKNHYREDSPEVQELVGTIAKLDDLLAKEPAVVEKGSTQAINTVKQNLVTSRGSLLVQLQGAKASLATTEELAANLRARLAMVPEMQATIHDLDRKYALAQEKYQAFVVKRAQAGVSITTAQSAMPSMRVVAYAMTPGGKYWPRAKILYPLALMVGLFMGVVGAVLLNFLSGKVGREDVERGRRDVPLYATVTVPSRGRAIEVLSRGKAAAAAPSDH